MDQANLPAQPVSLVCSFCEFRPTRGLSLRHGARCNPHGIPRSLASDAGTLDFGLLALTAAENQCQTPRQAPVVVLNFNPLPIYGPIDVKTRPEMV
jgi:hypothetical protein